MKADELGRMREFNESILESLDVGLAVVDDEDRVVRWNRALESVFGLSPADAIGRSLAELFDAAFVEAIQSARRESPRRREPLPAVAHAARVAARRRVLVNVTTVPLRAIEGAGAAASGTVIIIDDVTARVQLEEQLQISDKMASIGLLAAGVAHEVNTPLTGISSFTQMLLEGADQDDPRTRLLEKIERQTFRAAKIVNGLLNLSRPSAGNERAPVDLNVVINDVLSLLEHQFKVARIQVRRDLVSPGPVVMGIEHKLQQVFLNLFLNARDAMPKGGWLSIATRVADGAAVAEVGDTGSGIPSEHLARIYDPFFTTKAIGQGTGLGLSITYGIVREHDGTIACDSEVGVGTRFSLSFRLVAAAARSGRAGCPQVTSNPAEAGFHVPPHVESQEWSRSWRLGLRRELAAEGRQQPHTMPRNGTILVVDDEEIMREILENPPVAGGVRRAPRARAATRRSRSPAPCRWTPPSWTS